MIPYDELVVALTNWRIAQGLPTGNVQFAPQDTGSVDLDLPVSEPVLADAEELIEEQAVAPEAGELLYEAPEQVEEMAIEEAVDFAGGQETVMQEIPLDPEAAQSEDGNFDAPTAYVPDGQSALQEEIAEAASELGYDEETQYADSPAPISEEANLANFSDVDDEVDLPPAPLPLSAEESESSSEEIAIGEDLAVEEEIAVESEAAVEEEVVAVEEELAIESEVAVEEELAIESEVAVEEELVIASDSDDEPIEATAIADDIAIEDLSSLEEESTVLGVGAEDLPDIPKADS